MNEMIERFLAFLRSQGWKIEEANGPAVPLPEQVRERYRDLPAEWYELAAAAKSIISCDETTWFLCAEDYAARQVWRWNEWELLSLESADGDAAWMDEIHDFWDRHFPFIMSVGGGYSYFAVSMAEGSIVYGCEPEFEACRTVAASFGDFMEKVMDQKIQL